MTAPVNLVIEYAITVDMDNGRPLPPLIVDGVVWRIVRRLPGSRTYWRRICLAQQTRRSGAAVEH
jgi:hypothetical protein